MSCIIYTYTQVLSFLLNIFSLSVQRIRITSFLLQCDHLKSKEFSLLVFEMIEFNEFQFEETKDAKEDGPLKKPKLEERSDSTPTRATPVITKPILSNVPLIKTEPKKSDEITEEVNFMSRN